MGKAGAGAMALMALLAIAGAVNPGRAAEGSTREDKLDRLEAIADHLLRIKLSGVVQARWETSEDKFDTLSISNGTESTSNTERFYIKRARLKAAYDDGQHARGVVYLDGNDKRSFDLIEAYVSLYDPWTEDHRHSLTMGQMTVPFGFELEYSATKQEALERSLSARTLFPGERDRGVKIESKWNDRLHTTLGVFNGTTIKEDPNFVATDPNKNKALLARIRGTQGPVSGGISWSDAEGAVALSGPDVTTDKTRFGVDAQVAVNAVELGKFEVRGELYLGKQVNPDSVSALTTASGTGRVLAPGANADHLATNFVGGYVLVAQRFAEHYQVALRYQRFDPNTDVEHDAMHSVTLAAHGFYGKNVRASVAYEIRRSDAPDGAGGYRDPKDNEWTVQIQHAF